MKTLIITCGLPQSGKSTWSQKQRYPIVNRDSIRFAIGGSIRYFTEEKRVTEIERIMVVSLFKAGHDIIIVDATHLKKKYIETWEDFLAGQEGDYIVKVISFYTSLEECLERAKKNFPEDKHFPVVIRNMWENAEIGFVIPEFKIKYGEDINGKNNDG